MLANFITCLPSEIPRDIAFIPSILERVQRWQVSSMRSIRPQLANFLSEISCLRVRASHHSCVLSPSFIFTWTAITNNAFEICRNVSYWNVSYCCLGDITPKDLDLSLHGRGGPPISEVTCGGSTHLSSKEIQLKMRDRSNDIVTLTIANTCWSLCNAAVVVIFQNVY